MKKRYYLTLTKENVDAIKRDLTILNLPPSAMSGLLDEWLEKFRPTLHKMAERKLAGKQLSFEELIGDLFVEMGHTMADK